MAQDVLGRIGRTPLAELKHCSVGANASRVFAKLEMLNPTGSIKDRIVLHMLQDAEQKGVLKPGALLVEASSGNTASSLAWIGKAKGYRVAVAMPETSSPIKIAFVRQCGAELYLCPPGQYIAEARRIAKAAGGAFLLNQYDNPENIRAHYLHTGPEVWDQMEGAVDYFIACASSGGTVTGAGRFLKEMNPALKIIVPDPEGSVYHDYFHSGKIKKSAIKPYRTEGAGKHFVCGCMDFSLIDEIIRFNDDQALAAAKELAAKEGICAGLSSGAVLHAAQQLLRRLSSPARIAMIFPDSGLKYPALA